MSEAKKCPECGGELEKGVMQVPLYRADITFWGTENIEEKLVSQRVRSWFWQDMRDFPAWRCNKCQLAVFLMEKTKVLSDE
jgi:hypothetical protein